MIKVFMIVIVMTLGWFITEKIIPYDENEKEYALLSKKHTLFCKAIAQFMIICQHAGQNRLFTPLGGGGVAVFLILSGYGLSESYKRDSDKRFLGFWLKKAARTFLPYAILELVLLYKRQYTGVLDFILDVTGIDPVFWFMGIIASAYAVFSIFYLFPQLWKWKWVVLGSYSIALFLSGSYLHAEQAISFLLGVVISNFDNIKNCFKLKRTVFVSGILAVISLALKQVPILRAFEDTLAWYGIQLVLKVSIACFVLSFTYVYIRKLTNRMTLKLGEMSYELYLVHSESLSLLHLPVPAPVATVVFMGFILSVSFVFNIINNVLSERIKTFALYKHR